MNHLAPTSSPTPEQLRSILDPSIARARLGESAEAAFKHLEHLRVSAGR